jgi:hypothetical protein
MARSAIGIVALYEALGAGWQNEAAANEASSKQPH